VRGAGGDGGAFGIDEGNGGTGWEGTNQRMSNDMNGCLATGRTVE
jgi:hypothetical protein